MDDFDRDFDWDPEKELANIAKHNLSFGDVTVVFRDNRSIVIESNRDHADEERHLLIGFLGEDLVAVAFTQREEAVRIFSARRASRRERREYRTSTITQ